MQTRVAPGTATVVFFHSKIHRGLAFSEHILFQRISRTGLDMSRPFTFEFEFVVFVHG